MEIKTELFSACYSEETNTLTLAGCLRETDPEPYRQLDDLLDKILHVSKLSLICDLREMGDMNSAGLGVIYRFAASRRDNPDYILRIKANSQTYWQERYLPNVKKFLPNVQLEFHQKQA